MHELYNGSGHKRIVSQIWYNYQIFNVCICGMVFIMGFVFYYASGND